MSTDKDVFEMIEDEELTEAYVNGAYPYRPFSASILKSENMVLTSTVMENTLTLRVDDKANDDFWLQIRLPIQKLKDMISQAEAETPD